MRIVHSRVQHAVGQGSFHSASVEWRAGGGTLCRYDYVYDCGALAGSQATPALMRSIKRLDLEPRTDWRSSPVIDALVLSHMDCDHLNGADLLAGSFHVRRVFMPYLGADELMLVLASQAEGLSDDLVQQLHGLATGANATLFGVPVTQIMPNDNVPPAPALPGVDPNQPPDPQANEPANRSDGDQRVTGSLPGNVVSTVQGTGAPPGAKLSHQRPLELGSSEPSAAPDWRLKFWNRGVDDELLVLVFDALVDCHFPLHALHDPDSLQELTEWLAEKSNRKAALAAYQHAIQAYRPAWAHEAGGGKLANFLSLCLYSGPTATLARSVYSYWGGNSDRLWRSRPWRHSPSPNRLAHEGSIGWLGTGDAPLGEAPIWADFSHHFAQELKETLTVQVPHHGAAPKGGPRFFNPLLIAQPGMNAVISVGTKNTYGHPTTQVLKEAFAARANLEIVTEESWLGFHEFCQFET